MKTLDKRYLLIILIVVIAEIFVFNYRSLKSNILNYNEIEYNESTGANITDKNGDAKQIEIEIKNINTKIYNIYIDYTDLYTEIPLRTTVEVQYTDELFSGYSRDSGATRPMQHTMIQDYDKTKYIHCDFTGSSEKILLTVNNVKRC